MLEPEIAALPDGAVDHLGGFEEPSLVLLRTSRIGTSAELHLAPEHDGDLLVRMLMRSGMSACLHAPPHDHLLVTSRDLARDLVGDALLRQRAQRSKA